MPRAISTWSGRGLPVVESVLAWLAGVLRSGAGLGEYDSSEMSETSFEGRRGAGVYAGRFPLRMRSSFSSRFASLSSYRLVKRRSSMDGVSLDVPNGHSVNF